MPMLTTVAVGATLATLAATGADAWWCQGHMITAEIARENLESGVEATVNKYVTFMNEKGPFKKSPNMVEAACWADDLKSDGLYAMKGWHFIDQVYDPSGMPLPASAALQNDNVAANINTLDETLNSYKAKDYEWIMAFAVMNVLHFYGDVHQPLHATTLFSPEFPNSDYGGNLFKVYHSGTEYALHAVWDSVCFTYSGYWDRPLSTANSAKVVAAAKAVQAETEVSETLRKVHNGTVMAAEGKQYAITDAYADLTPNATLSESYVANCLKIAHLRLAEGGYRLANELNYLFGDSWETKTEDQKMAHSKVVLGRLREHRREFGLAPRARITQKKN